MDGSDGDGETQTGPIWALLDMEGEGLTMVPADTHLVAGRGSGTDVKLRDPGASRRHFEVHSAGGHLRIRDLGSTGGTYVNGRAVARDDLSPGDTVRAGASRLVAIQMQPSVPAGGDGILELALVRGDRVVARERIDRPLVVGRLPENDIVVDDPRVSRRHIEITPNGNTALLTDLAPANRVEVNGRPVQTSRTIAAGDRVHLAGLPDALVVESPAVESVPIAVEIAVLGRRDSLGVEIDAAPAATVGQVADELAERLGLGPRAGWTVCRVDAGLALNPTNRWIDAGVQRGDQLSLVPMPTTAQPAQIAPVRYGPPRVTLNQLPRTALPPVEHRVRSPRPPETQSLKGRGVSWQVMGGIAMIIAGGVIALIRPAYALFALVGGLVGLVSIGAGIMGDQSRRKHGVVQFRKRLEELDDELAAVRQTQTAALEASNAPPEDVVAWVEHRDRRLWERRPGDPDFLRLRMGSGARDALISVDDTATMSDSPYVGELTAVLGRHRRLTDAPVTTPDAAAGLIVGLVGNRRDVLDLASWLLIQAAALHAPGDLDIAITATNSEWAWARWLPHAERGDAVDVTWSSADAIALARRLAMVDDRDGHTRRGHPARLVIAPHGSDEAVAELVRSDVGANTLLIVMADSTRELPVGADIVVSVQGESALIEGMPDGATAIVTDRIDHESATRAARLMGHLVDPRRPPVQRSGQLGLLDLIGTPAIDAEDVEELWSDPSHPRLSAVVGNTLGDEPLVLGFRSDGVHGVVGGMTGSGKSEFLQTLLCSLALTHRPDQLTYFLIDFKGGATFATLAELPHVAGVVTDLEKDATLANRAFTALEAEMSRRKNILDDARVPGIVEYERLPEAAARPMPALLVVIDEFAELVRRQPDVKERLDLVAAQGRSLGVHLLLATQSPSDVVTPAIRSNTQVWIALRVGSDSESSVLLDHPDAARIPRDRPGRGYVRFGGAKEISGFQTARIARPRDDTGTPVTMRPFGPVAIGLREPDRPTVVGRMETELDLACAAIAQHCAENDIAPAVPLWLPPLGEWIAPVPCDVTPGRLEAAVGLLDDPAHQLQRTETVDLTTAGNVLVLGQRGSGKSMALRQLVYDLAERNGPSALHVYGVESGTGSLGKLATLPHTGASFAVADRERLHRLFDRLERVMNERREALAASGSTDFVAWRRTGASPEPWIVLAIDDYAAFKEVADGTGLGFLNDQLMSLCRGGPAVGIHVLATIAQPADMRMVLLALFGSRIVLRQAEAADYSVIDVRMRPGEIPPSIPGRAMVTGGLEVQLFAASEDRADDIARQCDSDGGGPDPILRLPTEVWRTQLSTARLGHPVIGVGGPEHRPLTIDMVRGESHLIVAGEGRSGRSTALLTVYEAIRSVQPATTFTVLTPRPSPLRGLGSRADIDAVATTSETMAEALRPLGTPAPHPRVLLVDDAEAIPPDLGVTLERLARDAGQLGVRTFVAGRTTDLARSFESWIRYLVSLRSGLLLCPAPDGGMLFDVRLPAVHVPLTPGRGFLCERGSATFIQVALPAVQRSDEPAGVEGKGVVGAE